MENPTDEIVARLEHEHPAWQVWVVHRVVGGPVWCARRWDGSGQAVNADSPEELAGYLQEQASGAD